MTGKTMQAILCDRPGGREVLHLGEAPIPAPAADEILVRIRATALNRADILQREGHYPPPPGASSIIGLELAGEVAALGSGVSKWRAGDRVFGLVPGGGYAQYAVIHQEMALPLPAGKSFEFGAAIPEAFLTAFQALLWNGRLRDGESALVHAGGSGVGTALIQIGRELGAKIFTTSSAAKCGLCRELGALRAIDYRAEDFVQVLSEETGGKGADIIIDFVGAPYFAKNIAAAAVDGRIVQLATMGGSTVEKLDLRQLMKKRISLVTSTLRSRSREYQIALNREFSLFARPRLESGVMAPVIHRSVSWRAIGDAHRMMEENENSGKIVLIVD
jgi:putative PIG3 family NAD(P)H quinone oxidoreductase